MTESDTTSLGKSALPARPAAGSGAYVPGTLLSERYRIVARLGRGGMGEVYRADDLRLGQAVALKFLSADLERDPAARERLLGEVRLARTISHPNVCRVYDVGDVASGRSFLTMEYIDGEDLASLLRRIGRLPATKALEIARQLCAGLAAAHDKGVLHRDLKPANVMIDGRGHVRIADFGIAVEATPDAATTDDAGTLAYMAPERFAGQPATVQSDLYALGLILYETYTGKPAFEARTQGEWRRVHTGSAPSSPSAIVADIEPAVERAILRCLDKNPARRPASAAQVAAALPGGDPLAAALAAGETPSPELVAASGEEGTLPRATALLWLGGIVVALAITIPLFAGSLLINHLPMPLDTSAMERRARETLVSLGYSTPPADWISDWHSEPNATRGGRLELLFAYRQSPDSLFDAIGVTPGAMGQQANFIDDARLSMDSEGRLRGMDIGGGRDYSDTGAAREVDWTPLLAAIGASSPPVPSVSRRWPPAYYADTRAAWTATIDGIPQEIEAAALRGRPMSLRVRSAGTPDEPSESPTIPGLTVIAIVVTTLLGVPVALAVMARRNLRLGRGDRRGAFRLAAFTFTGTGVLSLVFRHWNPENPLFLAAGLVVAVLLPLFFAFLTWVTYMAVEPYARRRWPGLLIGWTRIMDGRFHDGLVGQALLIGAAAGTFLVAVTAVIGRLNVWLGVGRHVHYDAWYTIAGALGSIGASAGFGVILIGLLGLGRIVFRRDWAAWLLLWIVLSLPSFAGAIINNLPINVALPEAFATGAILTALLYRFGLLSFVIAVMVVGVLTNSPLTLDTTRWYFWRGALPVAIVLGLAVWGFRNVLGKQSLLPEGLEE